ncbi:hypothetical protein MKX24_24440 [Klebsiella quasipneumoniae]|uniref:hypothetical protein n=1 Tax=Klebsiella/Raoultella group TaxID=2890311 RepID=UPI001F059DF9|nr:hypothetical protein [Klebsiella quasipneumoniae]MCH2031624.1 hypothetical protein [Klebsiella quasipneumoniae]
MSTYKTGNPLGSAAVKDLFDNAENLDFALNSLTALIWIDRLGKTRRSFFGMESAFVTQLTSQESRFNTFIQSSGYQIVGDYTAGPLTITEYNQLIRYNNELYKLTAATDIPFTTAGNTDETWTDTDAAHFVSVGDAALRQNLGSSEGTKNIGSGLTTLDKLLRVNIRQFGAHSRTEEGYETFDSGAAIQSAIEYVRSQGGGEVFFPEGDWHRSSLTQPAMLPGDDGTVAPAFIATGNDQNIAPEPVTTMYAALRSYHNVTLVGAGKGVTTISGDWGINSGPIGPDAGIGIYFGAESKSKNITYGLVGITLKNFFIGRYVDGISENSKEDDLYILNCGISGIIQGQERCISGEIVIAGCYSGDVIGGHWTQRNNSQNAANIPPYPAADVHLLGWADASPVDNYVAAQHSVPWGARHVAIDNFFDTYFFKSANSATTASGGRLSNTSDNTGAIPSWYGIAGRARTVLSRYGRQINNMDIFNLKLLRQHRTPIYVSTPSGRNPVHQAYIEGIGLVNPSLPKGAGNYFGIDVADPLRPGRSGIGYMLGEGGVQLDFFTEASNNQHVPLISSNKVRSAPETALTYVGALTDSGEVDRASVWDGTSTDIRYLRNFSSAFSQPIAFTLGGPTFRYAVGYFTPKLLVGGNQLSLSVARGYYIRNGNTITATVQFQSAGSITMGAGDVVISGLPFTIPDGVISVHHGQVTLFSLAAAGVVAMPLFNEATTTITLIKDSKGTKLNGSETSAGVLYLNLSFTMSIVG